jgi:glycosyltransferase involved in cell wall biosynthesis
MLPAVGSPVIKFINQWLVSRRLRRILRERQMNRNVVLTTLPYVGSMLRGVPKQATIYYVTDDFSHWPGADHAAMVQADSDMSQGADLILAVSRALQLRYDDRRCKYFPHGVDWNHFASVDTRQPPASLQALPAPRIGFFGLIYEKLDFQLLSAVARRFSQASIVMIGPIDYCDAEFAALPNVHLLDRKPYDELPAWLAGLDVLLLPYANDPMIRQSGPLKLRECLATGKPTVSVDVPEVRPLVPHVRVAGGIDEFLAQVEDALREGIDDPARAARRERVRSDSWDSRAEELRVWLDSLALSTKDSADGTP